MNAIEVLRDGYGRVGEAVHEICDGLSPAALGYRIDEGSNPIGWLLWHLARVQDHHVSELAGSEQEWVRAGWAVRLGFDPSPDETGYGMTQEEVARVRIESVDLLVGYYDAVQAVTLGYLDTLSDSDLDDVVDERYDPPVTRGVRLTSVIADDLQHCGQAGYVLGVSERS